jgi:predicted TIM-barrel fold metal-dependent hydrolase
MLHPASRPSFAVLKGACDCHVHVFGPFDRFPLSASRSYTPPPALTADLISRMDIAGVERAVIVQPSAYGTDNRCTLDAVRAHPDQLRAVAVIDGTEPDQLLEGMHRSGVRGIRLNIISGGGPTAASFRAMIERVARHIAPLGWHIQIYAPLATIAEQTSLLRELPTDIVIDHMGKPDAAAGPDQPGFAVLLDLLRTGKFWVKLSGPYRISPDLLGNASVVRIARALLAAAPDRAVWGSDWPYLGGHAGVARHDAPPIDYRPIDYGRLLSVAPEWAGNEVLLRKVLVDNPARLYGF